MQDELMELETSLADNERKMHRAQEQQKRMERIIEICDINKIQNEEWIRGLNYY